METQSRFIYTYASVHSEQITNSLAHLPLSIYVVDYACVHLRSMISS